MIGIPGNVNFRFQEYFNVNQYVWMHNDSDAKVLQFNTLELLAQEMLFIVYSKKPSEKSMVFMNNERRVDVNCSWLWLQLKSRSKLSNHGLS